MYVRMRDAGLYIRTYIRMYVCMHDAGLHIRMYVRTYVHTYVRICDADLYLPSVRTYIPTYLPTCGSTVTYTDLIQI